MKKYERPTFLKNRNLELIFFAGKGGSGKTTAAAATALYQSEKGRRVMIVSIDPAHSLGDIFGQPLSSEPRMIEGSRGLFAMEMDASKILADFNLNYEAQMKQAMERGTYFDRFDIDSLFSLSMPGLDEVTAVLEIIKFIKEKEYDLVIVDTAPTGHTLVFLSLPDVLNKWLEILDLMQSKYRFMVKQFTGRYRQDSVDKFIKEITEDLSYLSSFLSDEKKCEFVPVANPEFLSLKETDNLLAELKKYKISVKSIIINKVLQPQNKADFNGNCPFCSSRKEEQEKYVSRLKGSLYNYNLVDVPLFPYEILGLKRLDSFKEALLGRKTIFDFERNFALSQQHSAQIINNDFLSINAQPEGVKFIFFGGKGGVGKTTLAASAGLFISINKPDEKVLVVSTDPAHSLKDIFELDEDPQLEEIRINEGLYILELNAEQLFKNYKEEYRGNIEEAFGGIMPSSDRANSNMDRGIEVKFDREIMQELINFSPPGIDEIMALVKLISFIEEEKFTLYIIDTSATGHLLRFLELPAIIEEWNKVFLKMLLKYKVNSNVLKEKMLVFLKKVKRVEEILKDQKLTRFFVVTIAEALGIAETERLLAALKNLSIPCKDIVINFIIPENKCSFCSLKGFEQRKYLKEFIKNKSDDNSIALVPLKAGEIKGKEEILNFGRVLFSNN